MEDNAKKVSIQGGQIICLSQPSKSKGVQKSWSAKEIAYVMKAKERQRGNGSEETVFDGMGAEEERGGIIREDEGATIAE